VREMTQKVLNHCEFGMALSDRIRRWRQLTEKCTTPLGLTLGEFRVLRVLSESGPSPMIDLAKEQIITGAAMTSIVDHLEKLSLIERVRSDSDRRVVSVAISRKGQDAVKQGLALYRKLIEKATHHITEQERRDLLAILDNMISSVQED
jgi:MarR family 2-MHQ and catechol resistance regulon transcriptional repressor